MSHDHAELFERFRPYTMVDEASFVANLALAGSARDVPGAIVECGVWRGGMIAGLAASLGQYRRFVLFDSFAGLPPAQAIDGAAALAWQADKDGPAYYDNCRANEDCAHQAMRIAGCGNYEVHAGDFAQTLSRFSGGIALLRLDADWHAATKLCLEALFDKVVKGGLIVIDDYYVWDGCAIAVHEFLGARRAAERIRQFDRLVAFMVKQ